MTEIRYSYDGVPTVRRFARSDAFMRGLMGPFGSGKSSGCVVEIVRRAHAQAPGPDGVRRSRWVVIRNTYTQLRDTTIRTVHEWLPPDVFGEWRKSDHEYLVTQFEGVHLELLFRALDRPDHIRNLLSLELTGAWVNEAREVPWSIIDALQGRVGRYPAKRVGGATWYGIILDTNPPDDMSGWYRYFEERRPGNAEVFRQPSGLSDAAENRANLPDDYYENLAAGKDAEFRKVYVEGQYGFVIDGRPVFSEYADAIHCAEADPVSKRTARRGWDFGLTPSCTFSQALPDGRWLVFDELTSDDMGIERFSEQVLEHCDQEWADYAFEDFGDPAGAQRAQTDERTCFEILRGKGVSIVPGEQAVALRLESVRKPLGRLVDGCPGFVLHPRCKMLRRGFMGGYHFRRMQTATERYAETPEKNQYSHPMDALQYDASRLFGASVRGRAERKWKPIEYDNRGIV